MLQVAGMRERTIVINSFSKDFTMTGWRIGHIIAPDYIVNVIRQISWCSPTRQYLSAPPSTPWSTDMRYSLR